MTESILDSTKEFLDISPEDTSFDNDIILGINGALATLIQNGVGKPVLVHDNTTTWNDFKDPAQTNGNVIFEMVKNFVHLSTKMVFDPPTAAKSLQTLTDLRDETLWRLNVEYDADARDLEATLGTGKQNVTIEQLNAAIAAATEIQDPALDEYISKEGNV